LSKQAILSIYEKSAKVNLVTNAILKQNAKLLLKGLVGSSFSLVIKTVFEKADLPFLILFQDKEEAAYYLNDLENLINDQDVLFYPSSYRRPYQIEETDNANILLRAEVLNRINSRKKPSIIVSYPEAIFEKVVTKKELEKNTLKVSVSDQISIDFINEVLFEYNFKRVDFVSEPGEFSVRGGIVDVFSFSNDNPYRIEFFGNEVDSIRSFDVETQLSIATQKKINIIPNVDNKLLSESRESFLDYINENTVLILQNTEVLVTQFEKLYEKATEAFDKLSKEIKHNSPEELFINEKVFLKKALDFSILEIGNATTFNSSTTIDFNTKPQPSFNKQFDLLLNNLNENHFNGIKNYLFCSNEGQANRFQDIFNDIDSENSKPEISGQKDKFQTIVFPIYQGFIDEENQVACYTDHQIFERYHKFNIKNGYSKKQTLTLKELTTLSVGDYVTHIDHGIGKFGGLQKIQVEGKTQEAIKLAYADNDIVYVSIHSLHKISKYTGKDGVPPKIYKLGSGAWKALKQKTKARVKHIAFNLIQLYAKRRLEKGFQYAPDSYLQHELESSFIY
jgi:transcription-repair coupling factor (superfamily II helicase)